MKLIDLHPEWMNAGGHGVYNADGTPSARRTGVGVIFDCPCGAGGEDHQLYVPFSNPLDGGPSLERGWQRSGDTFETLTLTPSILRVRVRGEGCGWHGWVTNGEVTSC
jgi:hypothetical protein